ncbi:MAG: DUF167 domain-containing protein [bacterium]
MYIRVTVTPDAKKELFEDKGQGIYEIKVKEPAERNLANKRVTELVARHFMILPNKVRIVTGHRSHVKMLNVDN